MIEDGGRKNVENCGSNFGGIPTWALQGLLNGASWTKHGSKPGQAVANLWDKNKNGWIGFYYQRGYDGAGRVVVTRYKTL